MSDFRQYYAAERQRQELIQECHSLIALIANKPNCLKLLKIASDSLKMYAGYKIGRKNRFGN